MVGVGVLVGAGVLVGSGVAVGTGVSVGAGASVGAGVGSASCLFPQPAAAKSIIAAVNTSPFFKQILSLSAFVIRIIPISPYIRNY